MQTAESIEARLARLEANAELYTAHVENLIERVYVLEQQAAGITPKMSADEVTAAWDVWAARYDTRAEATVSHPEARFDDDPGWPHRPPDLPTPKDTR